MRSKLRPVVAGVLSSGLVLAAPLAPANPCSARSATRLHLAQKNPCAANPCAAKNKRNPCAAGKKKNPCAATNPCAAKNPCAARK